MIRGKKEANVLDKYVYIELEAGDTDVESPAVIRFKGVKFGRHTEITIFDKKCKPLRPVSLLAEKLLGVKNRELEKYPPQESVTKEFLSFIDNAHIILSDQDFCERAIGVKFNDVRTLADDRRSNGTRYFDERHFAVAEAASDKDLTVADVQRISECSFGDACDIADDLVFFGMLEKVGKVYKTKNKS